MSIGDFDGPFEFTPNEEWRDAGWEPGDLDYPDEWFDSLDDYFEELFDDMIDDLDFGVYEG